jgi:hypothetical protein
MTDVTIYHNPDCGTSRNTLELIRDADVEPTWWTRSVPGRRHPVPERITTTQKFEHRDASQAHRGIRR